MGDKKFETIGDGWSVIAEPEDNGSVTIKFTVWEDHMDGISVRRSVLCTPHGAQCIADDIGRAIVSASVAAIRGGK